MNFSLEIRNLGFPDYMMERLKLFHNFLENGHLLKLCICSKDARLPIQLQRAMAAEAEAAREARAKVRR